MPRSKKSEKSKPQAEKNGLGLVKVTPTTINTQPVADLHLLDMPAEILLHMASFLSPQDLLSLGKVCRTTKSVAQDGSLWEEKITRFQSATKKSITVKENKKLTFFELRASQFQSFQRRQRLLLQAIIDEDVASFSRINLLFADLNVLDANRKSIRTYLLECNNQVIKNLAYQSLKKNANGRIDQFILELALNLGQDLDELISVSSSGIDYKRAILESVENNHLAYLQYLVQQKPELIHTLDTNSNSLLMIAASKGHLDIIHFLKSEGLLRNHRNNRNESALHLAVRGGHTQSAIAVMWHNSHNYMDYNGDRATHYAARLGNLDCIKAFIPEVCFTPLELHPDMDEDMIGPLRELPTITSEQKVARIRLKHTIALLSKKNKASETVLSIAISNRNQALVKLCLDLHKRWWSSLNQEERTNPLTKNINILNFPEKFDPISVAIKNNDNEIVELLFDAGLELKNGMQLPVHVAATSGNLTMVKSIIEKSINFLNVQDSYQQTPLIRAAAAGHTEIVRFLLAKNAELHHATNLVVKDLTQGHSFTALHWATNRGHTEIVELLVLANASETIAMRSARQYAIIPLAKAGKLEAIRTLLLSNSAAIEDNQGDKKTPLMYAAENGHLELVQFLLSKGASSSIFTTSAPQSSCLDFAINNGHDTVALEFIRHGVFASKNPNRIHYLINVIEKSNLEDNEKDDLMKKLCFLALEHNLPPDEIVSQIRNRYPANWLTLCDTKGEAMIFKLMRCRAIFYTKLEDYLKDIDANLVDKTNTSLIYHAGHNENSNAVRVLLKKKANLCVLPSPMHRLLEQQYLEMPTIRQFIAADPAVLTFPNADGVTMLEKLVTRDHINPYEFKELYQALPNTPQGDAIKRKALLSAFQTKKWDNAAKLLHWGVTIDPQWYGEPDIKIPTPAQLRLLSYIETRSEQGMYKTYLSFFGCKIMGLGYSRDEKLAAARALRDITLNNDNRLYLYLNYNNVNALKDGELGAISAQCGF